MPVKVKAADTHSVPIFHTGLEHWNIIDAETGGVICCIQFAQVDHRSPRYQNYMEAQRNRAIVVAEAINRGLK